MTADTPLDRALSQPRTTGEARRALLRARGLTLADVAREVGCHLSVVSRVNAAKKRSESVERAIANRLGLRLQDAFPEWYGGGRRRRGPALEEGLRPGRGSGR